MGFLIWNSNVFTWSREKHWSLSYDFFSMPGQAINETNGNLASKIFKFVHRSRSHSKSCPSSGNNNVVITPERRRNVVLTSQWLSYVMRQLPPLVENTPGPECCLENGGCFVQGFCINIPVDTQRNNNDIITS